jgi:hypothetical protein
MPAEVHNGSNRPRYTAGRRGRGRRSRRSRAALHLDADDLGQLVNRWRPHLFDEAAGAQQGLKAQLLPFEHLYGRWFGGAACTPVPLET